MTMTEPLVSSKQRFAEWVVAHPDDVGRFVPRGQNDTDRDRATRMADVRIWAKSYVDGKPREWFCDWVWARADAAFGLWSDWRAEQELGPPDATTETPRADEVRSEPVHHLDGDFSRAATPVLQKIAELLEQIASFAAVTPGKYERLQRDVGALVQSVNELVRIFTANEAS